MKRKLLMMMLAGSVLGTGCSSKPTLPPIAQNERDGVEVALRAHRDAFRACYENEINADKRKEISGSMSAHFVIDILGKVREAKVGSSTLQNANVEQCVIQEIKKVQFAPPSDHVPITIKYPFHFKPIK